MKRNDPKIQLVEKSNDFVGIKIDNNQVDVYVPQVFRLYKNDKKLSRETYKYLLLFLKSIHIAKTIEHEKINKSDEEVEGIWPIESFLWIIEDYIENGYYYNREKIYTNERKNKLEKNNEISANLFGWKYYIR